MKRTRAEAAHTRGQILEAASQVFCEKGYASSCLEDVAHQAGVTRGAIYWHFSDKLALLDGLLATVALPLDGMQTRPSLERDCEALADALRETMSSPRYRRIAQILWACAVSANAPTSARQRVTASRERFGRYLMAVVNGAVHRGELAMAHSSDIAIRKDCVLAGLTGLAFDLLSADHAAEKNEILATIRLLFGLTRAEAGEACLTRAPL